MNGNLQTDKSEAKKVQQKAARYYMHGDKLICRSYSDPHLTCIKYPQTLEVLYKIHDGGIVDKNSEQMRLNLEMRLNLDFLEVEREKTIIQVASSQ
ncbi:hypothetical protein L3X38_003889 [Prunus dulcis]|uniref:Uncharacterized protein n=1 Tax=Prunus dulcis TaxID=3755 RepID=A0AAD4ZMW3_PRUDU|nr:hypothetical protein L3X38_003889 [Prunus dulcis]